MSETNIPHNWRDGIKRIPLHLLTFGIGGVIGAWFFGFFGWNFVSILFVWRAGMEFLDWYEGKDTAAKALIDLASQVAPAILTIAVKTLS